MKKHIIHALIGGLILTLVSPLYKSGQNIEPMPYLGGGYNSPVVNGIYVTPRSSPSLAHRGFPFPIASVAPDDDSVGGYYKSLNISYVVSDFAIYFVISFGAISAYNYLGARDTAAAKSKSASRPAKK